MVTKIKYFSVPKPLIDGQRSSPLTGDLFLTETGEIEVTAGSMWNSDERLSANLLAFCTRGNGILHIAGEQVPVSGEQFFIVPKGERFRYYSVQESSSHFLLALFDGPKARLLGREFSLVRNLIPSVNNRVAKREMLFDEIFLNLSRGYHDENLEYVNFCFGHLLATFIYANRTSDDLADEASPAVRRAINFMEKNLGEKLSLARLASEVGYSSTYLSTLFRKETNYPPLSYFSHLKILKACEFLDYTKMKVKEISFQLAYSDPYYFTRDFTRKMGLSPRNYRNRRS